MLRFLIVMLFTSLLANGQRVRSYVETVDIRTGEREVVFRDTGRYEAPNWSPDGRFLLLNKDGRMLRFDWSSRTMTPINTGFAMNCNNDHGISPDGRTMVISHYDQPPGKPIDYRTSTIYTLPIGGGTPRRITTLTPSFWHGWSPDGQTLAYVGEREIGGKKDFDIYTIPVAGGPERRLTDAPGLDDGPDYSPDGRFIYFNSYRSGRMQLWRMSADGSSPEQLTNDGHSNWFPHPSPDGKQVAYLCYVEDQQQAHPFGKDVKLRLLNPATNAVQDLTGVFFGGQGTINVPSWAPDSRKLAFVRYEVLP